MTSGLSWKLLSREWRSGELGILLLALVMAVSVVVGVSSFVSRLQSALLSESARFLAADMVLVSRTPVSDKWVQEAEALGLATSSGVGFPSMAVADIDHMALVSIKAVSTGYPLRGDLRWSREPYGEVIAEGSIPAAGEVWLAPRLFALLDVSVGDPILVGEAELRVTGAVRWTFHLLVSSSRAAGWSIACCLGEIVGRSPRLPSGSSLYSVRDNVLTRLTSRSPESVKRWIVLRASCCLPEVWRWC